MGRGGPSRLALTFVNAPEAVTQGQGGWAGTRVLRVRRAGALLRPSRSTSLYNRKGLCRALLAMAMVLDDLDLRILQELQRDGRASHRTLAAKLGTTTPTVGARLLRLQETGVLQGIHPTLAPRAIAGTLWAILARAPPAAQKGIVAALESGPDVERVLLLAGGRLLVLMRPGSPQAIAQLEALLADQGATSHEAWAVTDIPIERQPDLARHAAVAVCAQCRGPIHGEGASARIDGRRVWFCCAQCKATFLARHETAKRGAQAMGGKSATGKKAAPKGE